MPRYLCYCPDYPDALERRLAVRPKHLEGAKKDWADGIQSERAVVAALPLHKTYAQPKAARSCRSQAQQPSPARCPRELSTSWGAL